MPLASSQAFMLMAKAPQKRALAGVARPMKEPVWRVSSPRSVGQLHKGLQQGKDNGSRCQAKGDVIGQRVELLADTCRHPKHASTETIKEVKDGSDDNHRQGHHKITLQRIDCGGCAAEQIAEGQSIGDMLSDQT